MKPNGQGQVTLRQIGDNLAKPVRKTTPGLMHIPRDIGQLVIALYEVRNEKNGVDLAPAIEASYGAQGLVRMLDRQVMSFLSIVMRDHLLEEPNKVDFPVFSVTFDSTGEMAGQFGIETLEADLGGVVRALEYMTDTVYAAERYLELVARDLLPHTGEQPFDVAIQVLQGITEYVTEGLWIHLKSALLVASGGQPLSRAPRHQRRKNKTKRQPASARAG